MRFLFVFAVIFVVCSQQSFSVFAQNEVPPGVDIIFVIDQSGSMNYGAIIRSDDPRCLAGQADCPRLPQTDPNELAIASLKDALNPIVDQIFGRSIGRETVGLVKEEHNFGVILFGSDNLTQVAVPLTRVEIQQNVDNNTITSNIDNLLPLPAGRNLGDTDFDVAFREACAMLNCTVPTPDGRKRVVVVFTDGQPSGADRRNPTPYYQGLFSRHVELFDTATIWVVGLDRNDEFWSANQPFWEQIAPSRTARVTNPADISSKLAEIARQSIGGTNFGEFRACDNSSFVVEPYLGRLTLVLEYPDLNSRAKFKDANGNEIQAGQENVGYRAGSQTEYFTIAKPVPGEWKCEIVGDSVTPRFTNLVGAFQFAEMRVEETGDLVASTCRDFQLAVRYFDTDRVLISELENYPLQHTLTVSIPDNIQTRSLSLPRESDSRDRWVADSLPRESDSRDRWVADGAFSPDTTGGNYPVAVTVQSADTGKQLFTGTDMIRIDPNLPCIGAIITPRQGSQVAMHQMMSLLPMEFEVVLTQGGQPSTPSTSVFREPLTEILSATVTGPLGYEATVPLTPDPEARPGVFVGRIDTPPEVEGDYTFAVELRGTTAEDRVYVLPPQETTYTRIVGTWVRGWEIGSRLGALLGIVLLVALVGLFAYQIRPPYPRGTLQFQRRNSGDAVSTREWETIGSAIYPARQKWFGLFQTRSVTLKNGLPRTDDLRVRRMKVSHLAAGKVSGVRVELLLEGSKTTQRMDFTRDGQAHALAGGKYRVRYEAPPQHSSR